MIEPGYPDKEIAKCLRVSVEEDGDIIDQYITFTRVLNEQIKEKSQTQEAVMETIRICKDGNVLKKYLESREKEVLGIMMTLFK